MKFDMRCHTRAGSIGSEPPVEKYISPLKAKRDKISGDFAVIKGAEYDTQNIGHFIVVMPNHIHLRILSVRSMGVDTLAEMVHHFGRIPGPAHAFGAKSTGAVFFKSIREDSNSIKKFDFLEGFNTGETPYPNKMAQLLAGKYNKPCTGGSDSHRKEYVGTALPFLTAISRATAI